MSNTLHPNAYNFFIKWYVTPPQDRIPTSQQDFYSLVGISPEIVAEYQSRDSYYDDLYKEAKNWGRSKIPELLHTIYSEFKKTKKPALLEVYKKLLEVDKKEAGNNITFNVLNPSDDQYRQILAREARFIEGSSEEAPVELLPTNQ